ncbi:MAG: hypothetical protein LBD57_04460 [Endomicrobium sp.]|uniref:hypothetical protein n=1 Tax=Candidatus Endomicrobiellum cubanum TaxID=3242325 RepID=UPI00282B6DFF|nr:hypothetical protein [Endomicrobium sp.]
MIRLKKYQREAVNKLKNGSILCGDVGSGKSITALFYYFEKECGGKISKNPILMQDYVPLYIITTARKRDTLEWEKECSNIAIRPSSVIIDSWNNINKYRAVKDAFFIFDEQRVIGSGVWVKSFLRITQNNRWILLTATPGDTWLDYIPVFIANGFYKNRTEFIQRHVVYSNYSRYPKVEKYIELSRLLRLKNEILVIMHFIRQTKSHRQKILVNFDKIQQDIILKRRWNIYENRPITDISELCFTLRRLANTDPSRLEALLDIYNRNTRLIIFYNFNYELDLLVKFCEEHKIPYAQWNGHRHELIPKEIRWMYLIQYAAGGEGWNCIETNAMVFYSQNYSYKTMVQAAGRIDRLNTPFNDLYYYHLISHSLIDLAITKALSLKKNFNEQKYFRF